MLDCQTEEMPQWHGEVFVMPESTRWPDILMRFGIFKSKNDARRNGWDQDVAFGWSRTPKPVGKPPRGRIFRVYKCSLGLTP